MYRLDGIQLVTWPTLLLIIVCQLKTSLTSGGLGSLHTPSTTMSGSCWVSCTMFWRYIDCLAVLWPCDTLQILKDATLYFSHGTPNLAMVIPAMDYINEKFTNYLLMKDTLDPEIWAAIGLAKKTLNRYYEWMDFSELYCTAMGKFICIYWMDLLILLSIVLHPCHKLEYFQQAGWKPAWIRTAHNLVWTMFDESYATHHVPGELDESSMNDQANSHCFVT